MIWHVCYFCKFLFSILLRVLEARWNESRKLGKCVLSQQLVSLWNPFFIALGKKAGLFVGSVGPPFSFHLCLRNNGMRAKTKGGWRAQSGLKMVEGSGSHSSCWLNISEHWRLLPSSSAMVIFLVQTWGSWTMGYCPLNTTPSLTSRKY